jgi:hypothetical protein
LESKISGKRPIGKQRKRWINAVEIDIREVFNVRKWKKESVTQTSVAL